MDGAIDGAPGVSLIEVMIVVAMLSILSIGATMAVGLRGALDAPDARLLARLHDELRQEAIQTREARSLTVQPQAVAAWRRDGTGAWVPRGAERPLAGVAMATPGYGALDDGAGLRAVLLPDGRGSAFSVRLEAGRETWRCETDGWGPLSCTALR